MFSSSCDSNGSIIINPVFLSMHVIYDEESLSGVVLLMG
jgi:hypothetical protein